MSNINNSQTIVFKIAKGNIKRFVEILEYVNNYTENVVMQISSSGIFIQSFDASHVILSITELNRTFFSELMGEGKICVSIKPITKLINYIGTNGVSFSYNSATNKISVYSEQHEFKVVTMEIEDEEFSIPEDEVNKITKMEIEETSFFNTIKSLTNLGAETFFVHLKNGENNITIKTDTDTISGEVKIPFKDTNTTSCGNFTSKYNIKYFKDYSKLKGGLSMGFHFENNAFPLLLENSDNKSYTIKTFLSGMILDE